MRGVVAAGEKHTAEAAAEVLSEGGNAIDAAVAGALAAFVAEPLLASAGGAGMLTLAPARGAPAVVDFFPAAPGLGGRAQPLDFVAVTINFGAAAQTFHVGRGSAAVPLALPGLLEAARRFGSAPLSALAAPAVRLARRGVPLGPEGAHVFRLLWPIQCLSEGAMALCGGAAPPPGTMLTNPELADLLEETVEHGAVPPRFVQGLLEAFGVGAGGQLSEADVAAAAPRVVAPHTLATGDWTVLTSPRMGGLRMTTILARLTGSASERDEAREVLRVAEACRAGHDVAEGLGSTTHISVVDADGSAVSVTLTNGEGAGHVVPGTGVQVNNFLGEEDLNPRGFHRHAPGAPLPTMIAPTVALHRGRPALALGSGGSNRIRSVVAQVLARVMRGEALPDAVLAPRVHAERDDVWIERPGRGAPDLALELLATRFARVHPFDARDFFFGGVHAVRVEGGRAVGAADSRRGGAVVSA